MGITNMEQLERASALAGEHGQLTQIMDEVLSRPDVMVAICLEGGQVQMMESLKTPVLEYTRGALRDAITIRIAKLEEALAEMGVIL